MNIVSLEMDRDVEELTLTNSLESGITSESSRGDHADSKLDECFGWTNEKHKAYLDYLENYFVKQLYSFIGEETQRLSTTPDVQSKYNSLKSTDQFTVLQNCCWEKVNFGKKRVCTMGSGVQGKLLCNEETKHSGDYVGYECLAQSTAEASGQNFKEEEKRFVSEMTRKRESNRKCR